MNRIKNTLASNKKILSIYFSAGFPTINDTKTLIETLEKSGADMIEIGLPFSDPLADGPTIQASSIQALKNGMTTELLFEQITTIRKTVTIPLLIMGYFNPILQFGIENFCKKCAEIGIDGLIIPDLPLDIYLENYKELFESHDIAMIFLITPQTTEERIRRIDANSNTFIYLVSSSSVTGSKERFDDSQMDYFKRIEAMNLQNPQLIGFGISNKTTYNQALKHQKGVIIGSSFIEFLTKNSISSIPNFIDNLLHVK
jgi:tryptophan synthase alpha chain